MSTSNETAIVEPSDHPSAGLNDTTRDNSIAIGNIVGLTAVQGDLANVRFFFVIPIVVIILLCHTLTLWTVFTTDRLRVKAYALTTSLAGSVCKISRESMK